MWIKFVSKKRILILNRKLMAIVQKIQNCQN